MSEEFDKSEQATPFKLREARKKGQVARSMEINHSIILLVFLLVGSAFADSIGHGFTQFFQSVWLSGHQVIFDNRSLNLWFANVITEMMVVFGPLLMVIMLAGIGANLLQTGPMFSTESLKFDFKKLNPAEGFKKLFSMLKLFELLKNSLKIVLIGVVLYLGFYFLVPQLFNLQNLNANAVDTLIVSKIVLAGMAVIVALIPITLLDHIFSRKEFAKKMKMSKREVKEEHKRHEGSPEIKNKRKQIQKELLKKTASMNKISEADLIVVNPTHYAVGLKYDQKTMKAPVVVVKGRGEMALKIREVAQSFGKSLYRKPLVARTLYSACDVDHPIPLEQFPPVAEIYRTHYASKRG